jgi:hypothetical protein
MNSAAVTNGKSAWEALVHHFLAAKEKEEGVKMDIEEKKETKMCARCFKPLLLADKSKTVCEPCHFNDVMGDLQIWDTVYKDLVTTPEYIQSKKK